MMNANDFIPVANPQLQVTALSKEIHRAVRKVLDSGSYILGEEVRFFEEEFAKFNGAAYCIGAASGTDALILALKAVGIEPGDEVITVSHTAVATVAAIEQIGAVPVFVDINPATRCMDPTPLPNLITAKTRAVLPVHIYGQPAPMDEIIKIAGENELKVIEDCAQAHGAEISGRRVGTFGDASAFSFYPTKNLGAIGDGGAVVTNSAAIAERVKEIREYGWRERYISATTGINSRLDELQAAILRVKLQHLENDGARRRQIAAEYRRALENGKVVSPPPVEDTVHAMHLFVVECAERDAFRSHLMKAGVGTALHYPLPVHQQPAYSGRIRGSNQLANTDRLCKRIVSLPMFPELNSAQVEKICSTLSEWSKQGD